MPKKPIPKRIPAVASLQHAARRDAAQVRLDALLERSDEILELYMAGYSFEMAMQAIRFDESPHYARYNLWLHAKEKYMAATKARSHQLIEKAVDVGRMAISLGDAGGMRVAVDTFLKVAGKINPDEFGDKARIEHTGKDGGAIETKADLSLSPSDAYLKMVSGK